MRVWSSGSANPFPAKRAGTSSAPAAVILEADRRPVTAAGLVEAEATPRRKIPTFHNQFARFRGIVWLDSDDSHAFRGIRRKPMWIRTAPIWQQTFLRMVEMMRPVIDFH